MKLGMLRRKAVAVVVAWTLLAGSGVDVGAQETSKVRSLASISSRAEFDTVSRVYNDKPYALPHVIFVIDRKDKNRIYYVNSKRYRFHKDFVNGTYLSLERGREFFENNYLKANRRFILGTLAYQTPVKRWTYRVLGGRFDSRRADQTRRRNHQPDVLRARRLQTKFAAAGGSIRQPSTGLSA